MERKRKRVQDRLPCNVEVLLDDTTVCSAFDISEGGIYVRTSKAFAAGSTMKISLYFRGEIMDIKARVKYCHEGVGLGLMFIDLDNALKMKIRDFIKDIT